MNSGKSRSNMITGTVGEVCTFFLHFPLFLFFFLPSCPKRQGTRLKVTSSRAQRCKQRAPFYIQTHECFTKASVDPGRGTAEFITPTQTATHVPDHSPPLPRGGWEDGRQPPRPLLFRPRGRWSITESSTSHRGKITLK